MKIDIKFHVEEEIELPVNYDKISYSERRKVREEYVRIQKGKCQYCDKSLSGDPCSSVLKKQLDKRLFPPNFLKHPVHLHHDHDTGMTIGAVHSYCNGVLWQYYGE